MNRPWLALVISVSLWADKRFQAALTCEASLEGLSPQMSNDGRGVAEHKKHAWLAGWMGGWHSGYATKKKGKVKHENTADTSAFMRSILVHVDFKPHLCLQRLNPSDQQPCLMRALSPSSFQFLLL